MSATTYKCPNCGAAMSFDSATQKLACASCGTNIDVVDYDKYIKELESEYNDNNNEEFSSDAGEYDGDSSENMKVFHCQSCGAKLVTDKFTSATFCSYCGNPNLVEERLDGEFSPDYVIPFKINKDAAVTAYKDWLKKGILTPRSLARNSVVEKISGIYVPFWLYDYSANSKMNALANRVRVVRRGDYEYTYTDHYRIYRDVSANFDKIPADASEKMPDERMDKLEPFNYQELVEFKKGYLQGYLSEKYNYNAEEIEDRTKSRAKESITNITRGTIKGYTSVVVNGNDVSVSDLKNTYALLPVWMLNFKYNDKNYSFYINGQTGKIVADRPVSIKRGIVFFITVFIIILVILMIGGLYI
ncbi:hypothetical protein [Lachnospira multipara]|uniref:hypothetical protein n=1 Tax=Lachnospira multipara TaxID=28051 RepID=UPI000483589F|nr:hypothetical protein [Lachnospira multipara]